MNNFFLRFESEQTPGELGVWMFVLGDMILFALLFDSYAWDRSKNEPLFVEFQAVLNTTFGLINTLLLLTGSLFVALSVHAARFSEFQQAKRWLACAILCGISFMIFKVFEYQEKIDQGYSLVSNDFFMYYYMMTGIHLFHVLVATGVLLFMFSHAQKEGLQEGNVRSLESAGIFWHMVDLIWIMLFSILYVVV